MEELLSLKWNNHRSTFLHILAILRDKQAYTDVTLACDGKFYNVHKLVLSTCSDYFSAMFDKTDKTCKSPIIVLKDIKCEDLESLLDYMYLGEVNVRQCDLASLIKSAECLRIKGLAVPDDEPPKKVPNRTESNRRDNVSSGRDNVSSGRDNVGGRDNISGSPPPKRKRREEGEDGRDDVRPIEPSPQPSTSRPKNDSSQRLSPSPHRTPQESPKVEERLIRPPPTSTESRSLPSTSGTSGGGGGGDSGGGSGSGNASASGGASVSGGASGGTGEQFRSQSENQTFVKVEVDDNESHDDSQVDSYNMGMDGYKEESEGDFGDLSNDLPEFLQQASSGSLQGSSFHQFPGPSGFQDASGSSWQGDGQSLAGNFSGLGFSHQEGSQNPGSCVDTESFSKGSGWMNLMGENSSTFYQRDAVSLNLGEADWSLRASISNKKYLSQANPSVTSTCPICSKVFVGSRRKYHLERHLITHTGERPFPCPHCPYRANVRENLSRHMKHRHPVVNQGQVPNEQQIKSNWGAK